MTVTVTVTDPARVPDMERVFGSATVPVKGSLPEFAYLPMNGREVRREVYYVNVVRLNAEQREKVIAYGIERFGLSREECESELYAHGFPILADSCIVSNDRPDFL